MNITSSGTTATTANPWTLTALGSLYNVAPAITSPPLPAGFKPSQVRLLSGVLKIFYQGTVNNLSGTV